MNEAFSKPDLNSYRTFRDLEQKEVKGRDFEIQLEKRDSKFAIIAPHGGRIEPQTTEIAHYLAGDTHSFYSLIGKRDSKNGILHIKSELFDEPELLELLKTTETVIAIHGIGDNDAEFIVLGGLDESLKLAIAESLKVMGFDLRTLEPAPGRATGLAGINPNNICNKGTSGKGIQIEISRMLRERLLNDRELLENFKKAIILYIK